MKRFLRLAALCIAVFLSAAHANENTQQNLVDLISGNTLEVTNRYAVTPIYFSPDGKFLQTGPDGAIVAGNWRVNGDQLCATVRKEREGALASEFCMSLAGKRMGDTWTTEDARNGTIRFKLMQGRGLPSR